MSIDAARIDAWAESPDARHTLPELVRRLLLQAGVPIHRLHMPSGSGADLPGFDGIVEADAGKAWVPEGRTVVELSCERDPARKARADLAKRSRATSREEKAATTFIFVTPRRWCRKSDWTAEAKGQGWKEVRAYDADDLAAWLEATPAVAVWFAETLGLAGPGVTSPEAFLERWGKACAPAITALALRTGRQHPARELRRRLAESKGGPLILHADSEAEAVAFAAAVIGRAPRLAESALVVETAEGWRFVEQNPQLRIALCASSALAERAPARDDLLVLVPHAAGDPHARRQETDRRQVPILVIPRPAAWVMERALVRLGLDEPRAERLARQCGRSWSVFRRLNATPVPAWRPAWLTEPERRAIPLLALVDTFIDREGDREVVARIAGRPFEDIERELRILAVADDAPLLEIGPRFGPNRTFKAKPPLELLHLAGDRITSGEFERFLGEAARVLAEPSRRSGAVRFSGTSGYSDHLHEALAAALPRLAVRGPETGLSRLDVASKIERLVGELLAKADRTRWLSLAPYLPELAEAAPDHFLEAVEESLDAPDRPIAALFDESGSASFGRHYYAHLLWALERLAWCPLRLRRVCDVLCALSALPRPENLANSPPGSLANIFRPWLPQTDASVDDRLAVLEALERDHADLVFDLHLSMLPATHRATTIPNQRPAWRGEGLRAGGVTIAEYRRAVEAAADRAIDSASGHPERLVRLVEQLDRVRKAGREDALLAALARFAKESPPTKRASPVGALSASGSTSTSFDRSDLFLGALPPARSPEFTAPSPREISLHDTLGCSMQFFPTSPGRRPPTRRVSASSGGNAFAPCVRSCNVRASAACFASPRPVLNALASWVRPPCELASTRATSSAKPLRAASFRRRRIHRRRSPCAPPCTPLRFTCGALLWSC
jgi:hypothetical protein